MRIVVVEDNRPQWIAVMDVIEKAGYETKGVLVVQGDSCEEIRDAILHAKPDLILMDEMLTRSLHGYDVLKALGGEFYKPGIPGGNPRVISISGDPSDETLSLVGASFTGKYHLISKRESLKKMVEGELMEIIESCVKKL